MEKESSIAVYQPMIADIKQIILSGQELAYNAANKAMVLTYWQVGRRIVVQEQEGKERAEYGTALIETLSEALTGEFGKSYSKRNLQYFRKFYLAFPDEKIVNACVHNLNWTHFRSLLRVSDEDARIWYMNEAANEGWSARTLDRNIGTQYYYRLLQSPQKEKVIAEMQKKTAEYQKNKFELIKNPVVAEFLGYRTEDSFAETDLESAVLSHIRDFLMEMGKGFAFVARQQHIITDTQDYYIDLVFYSIELKCYVLVDLKMGTITHQDVGQIDMYVRLYDELKCKEGDNPTLGILLCGETSEDIARYSVLHDNERLFMSKYLTCLPTKEQLRTEIERQKEIFYMQHPTLQENRAASVQAAGRHAEISTRNMAKPNTENKTDAGAEQVTDRVRRELFAMQDLKFRDFQSKLMPTVNPETVIGVRTPALRSYAKAFGKTPEAEIFMAQLPHGYFEENNLHGFMIAGMKDYEACIEALDKFLPYVDNWATCDQMSPKVFKKHLPELIGEIRRWVASGETYTVRFGLGMLMQFYLDEAFEPEYLELAASVRSEEYYVKMMIAWYFATALAKQYDAALPYIEEQRLDAWTHNKAIQKAVESFRITAEQKVYLKSKKIKVRTKN